MILRRLMEHVRTQNWLAVALDFVIVVLGVFIGIQLGNWNEAGKAARHEAAVLEQLREEFGAFIEITQDRSVKLEASLDATRTLLATIRSNEEPSDRVAFIAVLSEAGRLEDAAPEPTTLAELISSGRLSEISSLPLRLELIRFHQAIVEHDEIGTLALQRISETHGGYHDAIFIDPATTTTAYDYDWDKVKDMRQQSQVMLVGKTMLLGQMNDLVAQAETIIVYIEEGFP